MSVIAVPFTDAFGPTVGRNVLSVKKGKLMLKDGMDGERNFRDVSETFLLTWVQEILAKPGKLSYQDRRCLGQINAEMKQRDREEIQRKDYATRRLRDRIKAATSTVP